MSIFDLLVLDGVYRREGEGCLRFVAVPAPSTEELKGLVQRIAERIGRSLERSGLITRDIDNADLAFDHLPDRNGPKRGPESVHTANTARRTGRAAA